MKSDSRIYQIDFYSKELKKLKSIEGKAWKYYQNLKTSHSESVVISRLRAEWEKEAKKLGVYGFERVCVLFDGEKHSYTFGDCLA